MSIRMKGRVHEPCVPECNGLRKWHPSSWQQEKGKQGSTQDWNHRKVLNLPNNTFAYPISQNLVTVTPGFKESWET